MADLRRYLSLLLASVAALGASGQSGTAREPPRSLDVTLSFFQVGREKLAGFELLLGNAVTPVDLQPLRRGRVALYRGPNPIIMVRTETGLDGRPHRIPVGRIELPAAVRNWTVFAVPGRKTNGKVDEMIFHPLPDEPRKPGSSTLLVYNGVNAPLGMVLADTRQLLSAGPSAAIDVTKWTRSETLLEFWVDATGGPRKVFGTQTAFAERARTTLVLLPPRRPGSWLIQCITVIEETGAEDPRADSSGL